ncbi:conserved hypothetical protein, membrane [mine drainage metagenome]|uniref:Uncharacterized protein n=1 Tax=mine drainage metagenome TaxID=410659 RepID=T0ZDR6_9ZZZZ
MSLPDFAVSLIKIPGKFVIRTVIAIALAIAHVSGALLLAPAAFLASLGVAGSVQSHRTGIALALLVSATTLIVRPLVTALATTLQRRTARINLRHRQMSLHNLNSAEARVLDGYVRRSAQIGYFELSDGAIRGLEEKGIIVRSSNSGHAIAGFPFKIQPWVQDYLNEHQELLPPRLD